MLWNLSFGTGSVGVLGDGLLLFFAAFLLLSYVGIGPTALLLPKGLRPMGWMAVPYLGYALLVTLCAVGVAVGANVASCLALTLLLASLLNCWLFFRSRGMWPLGGFRWWLLLVGLALPSYLITALSMAHSGTLGYVGPSSDPIWFIRSAEWLKTHPSPLFSLASPGLIAPYWNASYPPLDSWLAQGAHIGFRMAPYEEAYWTFSRGPRYLEASLGLLLGWDAALVFRPAQALMLAMAVPATFLFCRQWVRTSMAVSLLASLLVGLNSTLYFWVYLGHPGQASWTFLLPVTLAVTLAALGTRDRAACAAAVLLLSAHFISYCQASPVLPGLVGTAFLYYLMLGRGYRWQLFGVATAIVAGVLVLAFPEHLKMLLTQIGTGMYQAVGWGDPRVGPLSDALGTTPSDVTVGLVSSKGQIDQTTVSTWQSVSSYISPIAYLFMAIGLAAGRGAGLSTYRAVLLGDLLLLGYLAITNYGYGYTKLLSMTTFLFCVALAAGMVEAWRWCRATLASRKLPVARALASAAVAVAAASVVFMATVNLGVLVSSYWKMDRNLFNTGLWDASALNRILPQEAVTKLSPALFAEPQTLFYANYFLRDQRVQGPVALEWIWRRLVLLPLDESATRDAKATFGLFGKGEIASIQGLSPQDRLWAGSLMKAYRFPAAEAETVREVRGAEGQLQSLPALLPATVELRPAEGSASTDGGDEGALVVSLLSQGSAQLRLSSSLGEQSVQISGGLTVRSFPARTVDRLQFAVEAGGPVVAIATAWRDGADSVSISEYYPKVMAISGGSYLNGNRISVVFVHFDDQIPAGHSIDVYSSDGSDHVGWFSLPPLEGGEIRGIQLDLDPITMEHTLLIHGSPFEFPYSVFPQGKPGADGEYVGYLTTTYGGTNPNRIPLFRYRLERGEVIDFTPYPLLAAWDDTHLQQSWK